MSVPLGHVNGRNLVIASVGTSTEPSINYQESQEMPSERPNGGDLLAGDLWLNEVDDILYIFTTMGWAQVGLSKEYVDAVGQDLADRILKLDTLTATIEGKVNQLELTSATTDYVDTIGQDLADRIAQLDTLAATIEGKVNQLELTSATKTELTTEIDNLKTEIDSVAFKVAINETALSDHEQRLMDGGL